MCLLCINLMLFCLNCLLIMWADDFHYFYWEKNSFGLMIFRLSNLFRINQINFVSRGNNVHIHVHKYKRIV